ncbi:MAG: DUF2059 domain-containing protein [Proteobacteria bacterium]|nr:DUF2059 domain-containing protein [Pseudomonadota bacterium]
MRRTLAIALACLAATPLAFAQTAVSPAKQQMAQKMYDAANVGDVFQGIEVSIISNTMGEIGQGLGNKPETCPGLQQQAVQPHIAAFKGKLDPIFSGMADPQFKADATKVFADAFTEDEMRQILAFMQSPAGQKYSRTIGELNQRIYALAMTRAKTRGADINNAQRDFATTIQNIANACPASPAPATQPQKKR